MEDNIENKIKKAKSLTSILQNVGYEIDSCEYKTWSYDEKYNHIEVTCLTCDFILVIELYDNLEDTTIRLDEEDDVPYFSIKQLEAITKFCKKYFEK